MTPAIHLSEEALDDVIIGLGTEQSHAHLDVCAECRAHITIIHGDVALFNAASMAWSQSRRPKAHPNPLQPRDRRIPAAFAGSASAAAALVVMAFGIWHHRPETLSNPANSLRVQPSEPVDSEAQISQDNQLLQAVSAAISPDEASPMVEYKILEGPQRHSMAHSKTRMK